MDECALQGKWGRFRGRAEVPGQGGRHGRGGAQRQPVIDTGLLSAPLERSSSLTVSLETILFGIQREREETLWMGMGESSGTWFRSLAQEGCDGSWGAA